MDGLKITINALQYRNSSSGIGIMIRELFGSFTHQTRRSCFVVLPKNCPEFPHHSSAHLAFAPCTYEEGVRRILFQSFLLGYRYCRNSVLLTVDSKIPLLLPRSCRLIPIITDLALFRMSSVYQRSRVFLWKLQYARLRRRADSFIAISEFTKREMEELLHIPSERIDVVSCASPEGISKVFDPALIEALRRKYDLPPRFVLFVGNTNPRKNLERLISAFDLIKERSSLPHQLIIAGGQGWRFDSGAVLRGVKHAESIRFIGYVSDEDMPALYTAAELFAFPTLYEGFGIPVIEAQRCGTAVMTSNTSSLPEVGGEGAAYVDPLRTEDIADHMEALLLDGTARQRLIEKGYENARRFSWDASAKRLNDIIEERIKQWI